MATLQALIRDVPVTVIGSPDTLITGISYDSRRVQPGDLFACLPGTRTHGHRYIPDVLMAGAAALLVEDAGEVPPGVSALVATDAREALSWIAANFHGRPGEALTLIGVTGTNGKTTVTTLLQGILQAAGHPTGLIGTLAYRFGDTVEPAPHTTPMAADLQALLARMKDAGLTHAVMEVSSHALIQHRVKGCRFRAVALTNLTQDHLDFHGTMEAYREAKMQLFTDPVYRPRHEERAAVLNADDPSAPVFAARVAEKRYQEPFYSPSLPPSSITVTALEPSHHKKVPGTFFPRTYGLGPADYQALDVRLSASGSTFVLQHPAGTLDIRTQLVGAFNVSNTLAAAALALEIGVAPAVVAEALAAAAPVDGRFQRVPIAHGSAVGQPGVIVDYAHTPDGLAKALETANEIAPGRVIVVFGCGGDRDRSKRPQMAAVAARGARDLVITSDNPRSEDPMAIIRDIVAGLSAADQARTVIEPDRAAAIRRAILNAGPDDLVLLAGKGHETYQIFADRTVHFDDREEAAAALAAWAAQHA